MDNFHLSAEDEADLLALRVKANLRSAIRNDSAVTDILETSVYSVVYHYDVEVGVWEKQKQEGPLFLVKRSKHPEYGLFMLNRQTVKNVLLPLIPGETRVTITDANNLTLAWRGERSRKGVWFSEGLETVERFAAAILGVCGEPSKRPEQPGPSIGALSTAAPLAHGPLTIEDTFASLFADVIKAHPFIPVRAAAPPFPLTSPPITRPSFPPIPSIVRAEHRPPRQPAFVPPPVPEHTQYQRYSPSPAPIPAPVAQEFVHPPRQPAFVPPPVPEQTQYSRYSCSSAATPPPGAPNSVQSPRQPASVPPPPIPQYQHYSHYCHSPSPTPPPAVQESVHPPGQTVDELLMSLLGVAAPPPPALPAYRNHVTNARAPSPALPSSASLAVPQQDPLPAPLPPQLRSRSTKVGEATFAQTAAKPRLSSSPNMTNGAIPSSFASHQESIVDAVVRQDQRDGLSPGRSESKMAFAQDILRLIHTEPKFVDDLWQGYLARKGGNAYG